MSVTYIINYVSNLCLLPYIIADVCYLYYKLCQLMSVTYIITYVSNLCLLPIL